MTNESAPLSIGDRVPCSHGVAAWSDMVPPSGDRASASVSGLPQPKGSVGEADDEVSRQIDELVAAAHVRLPRDQAQCTGAAYARFSTRFQHSIADQVRTLLDAAVERGIFVPREFIFVDEAVRGYRKNREGLNALKGVLASGKVHALLVFATNRLFRKAYLAGLFIEEEIVARDLRAIFVEQNIDTASGDSWRLPLQIHAAVDESGTSMYAANIRSAQQGLFLNGLVTGKLPLGYHGVETDGRPTRRGLPRRRIAIDADASKWVHRIYDWYVTKRRSIARIVQLMNSLPNAPQPPNSPSGKWSRLPIRRLLQNPRYRGHWEYGRTKGVYQAGKDYVRQLPREDALQTAQREELRIINDDLWHAAQARLVEHSNSRGRRPRDGVRQTRPKVLNGLLLCPDHDRRLYVGGVHGQYMFCRDCQGVPAEQRPLYTQLKRTLALQRVCDRLAELMLGDPKLPAMIVADCQRLAAEAQRPDPTHVHELEARIRRLTQSITLLVDSPGESDIDREETARHLRERRAERAELQSELATLRAAAERPPNVPTVAEAQALLQSLAKHLQTASASDRADDAELVREMIRRLTGGRIEVIQRGERRRGRGWLVGRFQVALLPYLVAQASGQPQAESAAGVEIEVDFREDEFPAEQLDLVLQLDEQGLYINQMADQLSCSKTRARRLLDAAYQREGKVCAGGHQRRAELERERAVPRHIELADRAKELADTGLLYHEIATELRVCANTITRAIQHWYTSRGLTPPDGRSRRKTLSRKSAAKE